MPSLAAALNRHHAKLADMHTGTIILSGVSHRAAVGITPATLEMEEGGLRPGERLTAHLSKSLLASAPSPKATITHAGKTWVIESVLGHEAWAREWVIIAVR